MKFLSPQQRAVVAELMTGASQKIIAKRLGREIGTVKGHIVAAYKKLEVRSQPELMARYMSATEAGSRLTQTGEIK